MAEQEPNAGPTPEEVQHGMQATRDHLGAGVEALGARAVGYARDAAEAVEGVMHGVRQATADGAASARRAVTDTVAFAGRAVDVRAHVRRHPWVAAGMAVAAGFACARFLDRR